MRVKAFLRDAIRAQDWSGLLLLALAAVIGLWLVAMPFLPVVQRATIARFHLATKPFLFWAAQQSIPAMYNLENRCWTADEALTLAQLEAVPGQREPVWLNHFPLRIVTFADSRPRWKAMPARPQDGAVPPPRFLLVDSVYQGESRFSRFEIRPAGEGGLELVRLEQQP
jgi:hypothetical protein